jgi:hypothetical protein
MESRSVKQLGCEDLRRWAREWADRIYEFEAGITYGGMAI